MNIIVRVFYEEFMNCLWRVLFKFGQTVCEWTAIFERIIPERIVNITTALNGLHKKKKRFVSAIQQKKEDNWFPLFFMINVQ